MVALWLVAVRPSGRDSVKPRGTASPVGADTGMIIEIRLTPAHPGTAETPSTGTCKPPMDTDKRPASAFALKPVTGIDNTSPGCAGWLGERKLRGIARRVPSKIVAAAWPELSMVKIPGAESLTGADAAALRPASVSTEMDSRPSRAEGQTKTTRSGDE